jgi:hypothetical protein
LQNLQSLSLSRNVCNSWNPKVHCCVHKDPSPAFILCQINTVHIITSYFFKIYFNIILPSTCRSPKVMSSFVSRKKKILFTHLTFSLRATCPTPVILLDLITLMYFVKCTRYEAPQYSIFFSLLLLPSSSVQIFLSIPYSLTPSTFP